MWLKYIPDFDISLIIAIWLTVWFNHHIYLQHYCNTLTYLLPNDHQNTLVHRLLYLKAISIVL